MSGKGSAPRPFSDRAQFDSNFDAIFGKKEGQGESQPEVKDDGQEASGSPDRLPT